MTRSYSRCPCGSGRQAARARFDVVIAGKGITGETVLSSQLACRCRNERETTSQILRNPRLARRVAEQEGLGGLVRSDARGSLPGVGLLTEENKNFVLKDGPIRKHKPSRAG